MDNLLIVVKIIVCLQILLIIWFGVLSYLTRGYFFYRAKKNAQYIEQIKVLFQSCLDKGIPLTQDNAQMLIKSISNVLIVLPTLEQSHIQSEHLTAFKWQLSEWVLKPAARQLSSSRSIFKRYLATQLFSYGFDSHDESKLLGLLHDNATLVAINAAVSGVKYSYSPLIQEMITLFSKRRRLQQSVYAEIMGAANPDLTGLIVERLQGEHDLYVKIFCYRLLLAMPPVEVLAPTAKKDSTSDSIDLKIAVLHYVALSLDLTKQEIIYSLAEDLHWEVRAAVAKALSHVSSERSIFLLSNLLCDSQWWVRTNAAKSLVEHGTPGIQVLEQFSPVFDSFAYQMAQEVLLTRRNQ